MNRGKRKNAVVAAARAVVIDVEFHGTTSECCGSIGRLTAALDALGETPEQAVVRCAREWASLRLAGNAYTEHSDALKAAVLALPEKT